jgi:hypothetical protein
MQTRSELLTPIVADAPQSVSFAVIKHSKRGRGLTGEPEVDDTLSGAVEFSILKPAKTEMTQDKSMSPYEYVITDISNSITSMLGKAANATMREAGKSASTDLWPGVAPASSEKEACATLKGLISQLGGFGSIDIAPNADGTFSIVFTDCAFSRFTEQSGAACGEQAICHFGFGLIAETLRRLTGTRVLVNLVSRDEENGMCHEIARPR